MAWASLALTFQPQTILHLIIEEPADLREVAIPLEKIVKHRGLAEEGVVVPQHPPHPLLVRPHESLRLVALHVPPHLLVLFHLRVPDRQTVCDQEDFELCAVSVVVSCT